MHPAETAPITALQRWLLRLVALTAALLGMVYSYDFGQVIGGPIVGVVLALNGAVFCSIVAGALAEKLCRRWPKAHREADVSLPLRPGSQRSTGSLRWRSAEGSAAARGPGPWQSSG